MTYLSSVPLRVAAAALVRWWSPHFDWCRGHGSVELRESHFISSEVRNWIHVVHAPTCTQYSCSLSLAVWVCLPRHGKDKNGSGWELPDPDFLPLHRWGNARTEWCTRMKNTDDMTSLNIRLLVVLCPLLGYPCQAFLAMYAFITMQYMCKISRFHRGSLAILPSFLLQHQLEWMGGT